jgi:hypothetical protein
VVTLLKPPLRNAPHRDNTCSISMGLPTATQGVPGSIVLTYSTGIGKTMNNMAEFIALIQELVICSHLKTVRLLVEYDSLLIKSNTD